MFSVAQILNWRTEKKFNFLLKSLSFNCPNLKLENRKIGLIFKCYRSQFGKLKTQTEIQNFFLFF